jgi:hypothetical protein
MILQAVKFNPCRRGHGWVRSAQQGGSRWILPSYAHPQYTALKASVIQPQINELTREPPARGALHVLNLYGFAISLAYPSVRRRVIYFFRDTFNEQL